jgi:IstB-like ATP binding protein
MAKHVRQRDGRARLQRGDRVFGDYEHTSVMIMTNLELAEWSSVFGDAKMTTAPGHGDRHATGHRLVGLGAAARARAWPSL